MNLSRYRLSMDCPWTLRKVARPAGLEPATPGLEGRCSIQLSYGRGRPDLTASRRSRRPADFGCKLTAHDSTRPVADAHQALARAPRQPAPRDQGTLRRRVRRAAERIPGTGAARLLHPRARPAGLQPGRARRLRLHPVEARGYRGRDHRARRSDACGRTPGSPGRPRRSGSRPPDRRTPHASRRAKCSDSGRRGRTASATTPASPRRSTDPISRSTATPVRSCSATTVVISSSRAASTGCRR